MLESIGADSVYQYFLGTNVWKWLFASAIFSAQIGALFVFVHGAEYDLSDLNSDLVYSWRCSPDKDECENNSDLDWRGWTVFGILMAAHLLEVRARDCHKSF